MGKLSLEKFVKNVAERSLGKCVYYKSSESDQVKDFKDKLFEYLSSNEDEDCKNGIGAMVICLINAAWFITEVDNIKSENQVLTELEINGVCINVKNRMYCKAISYLEHEARACGYDFEECLYMAWGKMRVSK